MKPFRPYHFPPLHQPGAATQGNAEQWQAALDEGFRQGQRDGHAAGLDQGRVDGERQGLAQGRAQMLAEFGQLARPVDAMLASLDGLRSELRATQRKEVVELVAKVARQVIRAELALQPVQLLALVEEALAVLPPSRDGVEVFMNPEELRRVRELDPARAAQWMLLPDPGLEPGECRVRAGDHEADAGCQGRLAAVMEQVRAGLGAGEETA